MWHGNVDKNQHFPASVFMVEGRDVHKNGAHGVTLGKDMVVDETIGDGCNQVGTGPKSVLGKEKRTFS